MVLHVLRALFILLMAAVGWAVVSDTRVFSEYTWYTLSGCLVLGVLLICIDILAPRRKLAIFSGSILGLIVGILIAYGLSFAVRLVVEQIMPGDIDGSRDFLARRTATEDHIVLILGVVTCYLSISFILQTKDDFRFIIPYVEFRRQLKGYRPMVLDTSSLIDGRIADVMSTGIVDQQLIVPQFIVQELQAVADSADALKRKRGRRGLDVLTRLRALPRIEVITYDPSSRGQINETSVDQRLLNLAKDLDGRVLTTDFNLNKVAQLSGVDVINVNDLASALKPVVLPGEKMNIRLIKSGDEAGQGVGYLDDGTMVVVEHGRDFLDLEVEITVTNILQKASGKMIFGRVGPEPAPRPRSKPEVAAPSKLA